VDEGALHRDQRDSMSDLIPLEPGEWGLWRQAAVRSAGFPVDGLDLFGDGEELRLPALADDRRFREALTWQNQAALHNAVDRLSSAASGGRQRRRFETAASYWQRYCAKNDTIGFFGPVGWAQFTDEGPGAVLEPGRALLSWRTTRFEVWAIDAVADTLAADADVRRWIPPRRNPATLATGLDPADQELCARCDGRPAHEVGSLTDIERLVERGILQLAFRVPLGPHPERDLRAQLDAIGDQEVRGRCLAVLDELEAALAAVAAAAGDPDALGLALEALDRTFEALTSLAAHRRGGQMYAGRSVCYEECRRDLTLTLGPPVVEELARALVPMLAGARWYCGEVWAAGLRIVLDALGEARADGGARANGGGARVPLLEVWVRAAPRLMLPSTRQELHSRFDGLDAVVDEFQRRWSELLDGDLDRLTERAKAIFADARPAWPRAVFHGPDAQIAAEDVDALNRGEFQVVVGDFHPGAVPVGLGVFLTCHPDPEQVRRFIAAYYREPRLYLPVSRRFTRGGGRIYAAYATPADNCLLTADDTGMPDGYRCLSLAELWVEDGATEPVIVDADGAVVAPLAHAFEYHILLAGIEGYKPYRPVPHSPRITVGRTVLRREMWTFAGVDIPWADRADGLHDAARAWASAQAMPRRVFVLVSEQPKPIYVDFDSPALVAVLARQIRAVGRGEVRFSEMLPGPDHAWLVDAEGRRYTSELRLTAVDLRSGG
jgi:hypothetical protein